MEKRFQVFVSSTYQDLVSERQEVMHALLELDCIPAGMELFPAANQDQWSLIKKVIDESDFYLVISAGRYGTVGPDGHSYTEMEYRHALDTGKPVLAFLHKDLQQLPAGQVEPSDSGRAKLNAFRDLLQKRMCKFWKTPDELGSVVSRSLVRLINTTPAIGWIRADQITEDLVAGEVLKLKKTIEDLEGRLEQARVSAPSGSESLAQGADIFRVHFKFETEDRKGQSSEWPYTMDISWNQIFYDIGPLMLNEANDREIRLALNKMVRKRSQIPRSNDQKLNGQKRFHSFNISDDDFQTIKVQLRAVGLIAKSQRTRSVKDAQTYWTLTPYGDQVLTTLRAIPKKPIPEESDVETDTMEAAEGSELD